MQEKTPLILGIVSLVFGLLLLVLSASGALWPATPLGDRGMWATVLVFVLFGALGILLYRQRVGAAE